MTSKHYPTVDAGTLDAGVESRTRPKKPCCRRIDHTDVSRFESSIGWCKLEEGHLGQCTAELPHVIQSSHLRRSK